jgi:catechol 2,3-dioxygenase-like lactoylglutathione lyase family enzyme
MSEIEMKNQKNISEISDKEIPLGWLIIGLLAFVVFFNFVAKAQINTSEIRVQKIESVGFTVSDMDKAIDFYTRILPFEKISDKEIWGADFENLSGVFGARVRIVRLKLGSEILELTEYLASNGRPVPIDSKSNDRWFQHIAIIVSDMDKAFAKLRENKVRFASTAPQTLPVTIPNAAGIKAFYFKDFDNHVLEILEFPADKGSRKWHELSATGKLFLGIDHTAIVVGETEKGLQFYRNSLGLTVAGSSDNFGTEQEHLNNVQGAKLHITGLRTVEDGIAVEFLEYTAPTGGRLFPKDTKSNDLWHWQTSFVTKNADDLTNLLSIKLQSDFVSNGVILFKDIPFDFKKAAIMRDLDGHSVRLVEN